MGKSNSTVVAVEAGVVVLKSTGIRHDVFHFIEQCPLMQR